MAKIWYFTRLQLERMGDKADKPACCTLNQVTHAAQRTPWRQVLEKSKELRKAVTMRQDFLDKLPQGVKFFHPLLLESKFLKLLLPFFIHCEDAMFVAVGAVDLGKQALNT